MTRAKRAFTLIEVMVSVMIISVVIMALIQMQGNSAHIFSRFAKQIEINQFASFLIANENYGFENDSITLDKLFSEFVVEDDLRRELKKIKVEVDYEEVDQIDMSESSGDDEIYTEEESDGESEESSSKMIFEIGKTSLKVNDSSTSLVRLRFQ